jgi:hypothetical protein
MSTANDGHYYEHRNVIQISLDDWREVTTAGAVGNQATAAGGILASDTTPIMGAEATTEARAIIWAAGNSDIIASSWTLPPDFSGKDDVLVELWVLTDNAGGGGIEAATFSVLSSWDNGAQVTDTATDGVPATTAHKITATIAAGDVPDDARFLNLQLVLGTHANDPVHLLAAALSYVPKLKAA